MTKHELDIAYFLSFCIENYKTHIGMPGDAVMDFAFARKGKFVRAYLYK